jgi:hypothetical protein
MSSNAGDTQPEAVARAESAPSVGEATAVETDTGNEPGADKIAASFAAGAGAGAFAEAQGSGAAGEAAGSGEAEAGEADDAGSGDVTAKAGDAGEPTEVLALAHDDGPTELIEPGELIDLDEPVKLAEPVTVHEGGRRWQRVLIVVSFVIAALAVVGGAIAIVGSLTHGFKKPVEITYKKSAIFSLKTGDCLDPQGTQAYTLVACDKPHDAEVFGTFELPAGKWPGTTAARAAASSGCASRLAGYLNPQLAISLATTYVFPDSVAWQAGTRTVICEVQATSGQLSQSVRGA